MSKEKFEVFHNGNPIGFIPDKEWEISEIKTKAGTFYKNTIEDVSFSIKLKESVFSKIKRKIYHWFMTMRGYELHNNSITDIFSKPRYVKKSLVKYMQEIMGNCTITLTEAKGNERRKNTKND